MDSGQIHGPCQKCNKTMSAHINVSKKADHAFKRQGHQFDKYGSLASECNRCRLPFTLAHDHQGWEGRPCQLPRYTPGDILYLTLKYVRHVDSLVATN